MNVRELINELEKYPAGAEVVMYAKGEKIDPPYILSDGTQLRFDIDEEEIDFVQFEESWVALSSREVYLRQAAVAREVQTHAGV
jgi:hypothetical protein